MRSLRASSHASHIPDVPLVAPRPLSRPPEVTAEQVKMRWEREGGGADRNVKEEVFLIPQWYFSNTRSFAAMIGSSARRGWACTPALPAPHPPSHARSDFFCPTAWNILMPTILQGRKNCQGVPGGHPQDSEVRRIRQTKTVCSSVRARLIHDFI
jgi:hypothetical protein